MAITYEWVAEPVDKYDDIIDPMFCSTLAEAKNWKAEDFDGCVRIEYALVRNDGNDEDGLQERQYAYTHDGFEFDLGAKVPKRFIKEAQQSALPMHPSISDIVNAQLVPR